MGVTALLVAIAAAVAAPPDDCVVAVATPIYQGVGWSHFVDVADECDLAVTCEVGTTVDPEPTYTVHLAPGETIRVRTRYGSPTWVFDPLVTCEARIPPCTLPVLEDARYALGMLACSSCRRFVRETSSACPFCGAAVAHTRAPLGGFLGVVLGVSLAACGGSSDDDGGSSADTGSGSMTAAGSSDGGDTDSATGMMTGSDSVSAGATGPLYGPVTGFDSTGGSGDTGGESDSGTGGSDDESSSGTDTGDSTAGNDSVGPLYGPVTSGQ